MKCFKVEGEFLKKAPSSPYLYHQKRTLDELKQHSVVFNTYPTGAGKTRASLLYLKENPNNNVLFIAPTNELLKQHAEDIKEFVEKNDLKHIVIKIDATVIEKIRNNHRKGTTLYELLRNPLEFRKELGIQMIDYAGKRPSVVVVNPDIFYYCFYSLYGFLDKTNLLEIIIKNYNYIIVDEFHYYDAKQLANFLFFIILSKEFNYFENGRKICILTATPDDLIEEYLKRGGIDYIIVSPENEDKESEKYDKIKTLSSMKLLITNRELEDVVVENYSNSNFERDSVVISQSIYKINKLKQELLNIKISKEKIGVITGAINSEERKQAVNCSLILATPTVDIGYNFKKEGKKKQNIDDVITEAITSDQALQRIGRAGRVLGKSIQDEESTVILCVNDRCYEKLKEYPEEINRERLKDIISEIMPQRNIMKNYIESCSIVELCFPMSDIYSKMPYDLRNIVEELFDKAVKVFAPKSNYSFKYFRNKIRNYKKQCKFIRDYNQSSDKKEYIQYTDDYLFVQFLKSYRKEQGREEVIEQDILQDFSEDEIKQLKQYYEEEIIRYIKGEICKISALINFRGTDISKPALVFDKYYKFGQQNQIFIYDIFHLMRYYEIYWCDSKREWENLSNVKISEERININRLDQIDTFIIINKIREKPIEISWEFNFKGNHTQFENKYANTVEAVTNLYLVGYEYTKIGKERVYFPEKIAKAFQEQYIPVFTMPKASKEEYRIKSMLKNQPIYFQKLNIQFEENEREYLIITGTNSLIIDSAVKKMKDNPDVEEIFIF
ncbi:type I-D CRISPR-associated helicase Cas3' [Inediibacterium massiliense]|uniref:type I-D CRISPR-associated helicase Cas3' n=1 Tax=Inediibacterium massiliense TaxID=1658111 RepID=UPI0006B5DC19|nr:type I-D CRISPR-associated helicase Cas3' [Inediibacterium massiliense]